MDNKYIIMIIIKIISFYNNNSSSSNRCSFKLSRFKIKSNKK